MRQIAVWAVALAAFALPGCGDKGDDGDDGDGTGTQTGDDSQLESGTSTRTGTGTGTSTGTGTGGGAGPRSATLAADVTNGTLPLNVTFTLSAAGADADASWTLDFGDGEAETGNGTDLPMDVVHTYGATGNYTTLLTVTYGDGAEESSDPVIVAVEAATTGATYELEEELALPLAVPYTTPAGPSQAEFVRTAYDEGADGVFVQGYPFPAAPGGRITITATAPVDTSVPNFDDAPDYDLFLYGPDGAFIISSGQSGTNELIEQVAAADGEHLLIAWFFAGHAESSPAQVHILVE